jgi:malonyl-CoA O-methyltransferase
MRLARYAVGEVPGWILDAGCGTGYCASQLAQTFPTSRVVAFDLAPGMAAQAGQDPIMGLCGDLEHLPFKEQGVDLVVSNGVLHWCNDLGHVLRSFHRILKPGGTLAMSIYVSGTFRELAMAWQSIGEDAALRMVRMPDLGPSDLARLLQGAGFVKPQTEGMRMARYFQSAHEALAALKRGGLTNSGSGRAAGLLGKARYRQFLDAFAAQAGAAGLSLTYAALVAVAERP